MPGWREAGVQATWHTAAIGAAKPWNHPHLIYQHLYQPPTPHTAVRVIAAKSCQDTQTPAAQRKLLPHPLCFAQRADAAVALLLGLSVVAAAAVQREQQRMLPSLLRL
jgi:hypothetical protein